VSAHGLASEAQFCVFSVEENNSFVVAATETPVSGDYINEHIHSLADLNKLMN
jgi:hypothetical protein